MSHERTAIILAGYAVTSDTIVPIKTTSNVCRLCLASSGGLSTADNLASGLISFTSISFKIGRHFSLVRA